MRAMERGIDENGRSKDDRIRKDELLLSIPFKLKWAKIVQNFTSTRLTSILLVVVGIAF